MNIECEQGHPERTQPAFRFNDAVLRNLILTRKTAVTTPSPLVKEDEDESPPPCRPSPDSEESVETVEDGGACR